MYVLNYSNSNSFDQNNLITNFFRMVQSDERDFAGQQSAQFSPSSINKQFDSIHPIHKLNDWNNWSVIEENLKILYIHTSRPAKLPVDGFLLLLKVLVDHSDEQVIRQWVDIPYFFHYSEKGSRKLSHPPRKCGGGRGPPAFKMNLFEC